MVYNVAYKDGESKFTYIKRFAVISLIKDKIYNLTRGSENSKVLYFNPGNTPHKPVGMQMIPYSYILIDFSDIEQDPQAGFAFLKSCGYAGVELNLTDDVLGRLDELRPRRVGPQLEVAQEPRLVARGLLDRGLDLHLQLAVVVEDGPAVEVVIADRVVVVVRAGLRGVP